MLDEDEDDGLFDDDEEPRVGTPGYERKMAAYERLKASERTLCALWQRRLEDLTRLGDVLGSPLEERTHLWVTALGERVALLGGHLELVAVFPEEIVTLLREPGLDGAWSTADEMLSGDEEFDDEARDGVADDEDDGLGDQDDDGLEDGDVIEFANGDEHDGPTPDEPGTRSWEEVRAELPVDERRAFAYRRLMDPEQILYKLWERRREPMNWIGEALGSIIEEDNPLWVSALGEKVALLGGHLELLAMFQLRP